MSEYELSVCLFLFFLCNKLKAISHICCHIMQASPRCACWWSAVLTLKKPFKGKCKKADISVVMLTSNYRYVLFIHFVLKTHTLMWRSVLNKQWLYHTQRGTEQSVLYLCLFLLRNEALFLYKDNKKCHLMVDITYYITVCPQYI